MENEQSQSNFNKRTQRLPLFACSEGYGEVIHWTLKNPDYQSLGLCEVLYWQKVKVHDKKGIDRK